MIRILFALLISFVSTKAQLTPAVAANMKFAMDDIQKVFIGSTGIVIKPVYGASGKLVTQIKNGAPFDIFISADIAYADSIVKWKLAWDEKKVYAYGKLVLWTIRENIAPGLNIQILSDHSIQKIALGNLRTTVYGPAAKQLLSKLNIWDKIESKIVYGENISQVAHYIVSGAADIGFSAKSLVVSDEMKGKGVWIEIDSTLYDPMPQAAVKLQYGRNNNQKNTAVFYDFLYSQKSRKILSRYGYRLP